MIIPLRAFDPTQKIIWEVVISFSTLLTDKLINVSTIPFFIIIGYLIKNAKEVFSLNWADKITGSKSQKNNILKHLVKGLALYLITYVCFYPVDTAILMVESDGVNITETYRKKSAIDPFSRFKINMEGYKIPIIIGASIASFDFLLYDKDVGIIPFIFGSFYAEYVKDSFTIFKSYDLLMASNNYENMLKIISNETSDNIINDFRYINQRYADLGRNLLEVYNNEKVFNFFKNAQIGISTSTRAQIDDAHGLFGVGSAYLEVNIAQSNNGLSTRDLAKKIRADIVKLNSNIWNAKYVKSEINDHVYLQIKKSQELLDTIQRTLENLGDPSVMDDILKIITQIEFLRENIKNRYSALKAKITSDINNISLVLDFKNKKNVAGNESRNFVDASVSWIKNIVISPVIFVSSMADKAFSSTLEVGVFFMFQLIKVTYILIFLYRSVYIGMTVASVSFAMLKALLYQNPLIMFSPVKAYCICRLWDFAFILSGLLGYALPYAIAKNDFSSWGETSTGITMAMSISLLIQIVAMIFFIRKISWILKPETFNVISLNSANKIYEENIINHKTEYTNKNNTLNNLYSDSTLQNFINSKSSKNSILNNDNETILSNRESRFGLVSGKRR